MARETNEIRRDISETRQEIDEHLRELGGQVRGGLNVEQQARRNLPQVLGGAAVAGLFMGILFGHGGSEKHGYRMAAEKSRLDREWDRLAKERARLKGTSPFMDIEETLSDIP